VHDNQRLENDGPCAVAQAVLEDAEDLGDALLAGVRGDEDVLDIFGLGRCELVRVSWVVVYFAFALLLLCWRA
jgi:hypothetical protein